MKKIFLLLLLSISTLNNTSQIETAIDLSSAPDSLIYGVNEQVREMLGAAKKENELIDRIEAVSVADKPDVLVKIYFENGFFLQHFLGDPSPYS